MFVHGNGRKLGGGGRCVRSTDQFGAWRSFAPRKKSRTVFLQALDISGTNKASALWQAKPDLTCIDQLMSEIKPQRRSTR